MDGRGFLPRQADRPTHIEWGHKKRLARTVFPQSRRTMRSDAAPESLLIDKLIRHFWPWHVHEYPGYQAAASALWGCTVDSLKGYLYKGRVTLPVFEAIENHLVGQIEEAQALLVETRRLRAEREALERSRVGKVPWAMVVERDGPGSIPRDARWKGGRNAEMRAKRSRS